MNEINRIRDLPQHLHRTCIQHRSERGKNFTNVTAGAGQEKKDGCHYHIADEPSELESLNLLDEWQEWYESNAGATCKDCDPLVKSCCNEHAKEEQVHLHRQER